MGMGIGYYALDGHKRSWTGLRCDTTALWFPLLESCKVDSCTAVCVQGCGEASEVTRMTDRELKQSKMSSNFRTFETTHSELSVM